MENTLKELLRLSQLQWEALEKEDLDAFEALMDKKEACIDKLQALKQSKEITGELDYRALTEEIMTLERANRERFEKLYKETKGKLQKIRVQKKVHNVYGNPYTAAREEGIFYDKRGRR